MAATATPDIRNWRVWLPVYVGYYPFLGLLGPDQADAKMARREGA
jgi:hypothetical protein